MFGIFAGIAFWFPKMFGRMMSETLGKIHFWLTFIAFNVTFFPMHILGVGRRPAARGSVRAGSRAGWRRPG
jgi:cytochrome c oxidase subunit 1